MSASARGSRSLGNGSSHDHDVKSRHCPDIKPSQRPGLSQPLYQDERSDAVIPRLDSQPRKLLNLGYFATRAVQGQSRLSGTGQTRRGKRSRRRQRLVDNKRSGVSLVSVVSAGTNGGDGSGGNKRRDWDWEGCFQQVDPPQ